MKHTYGFTLLELLIVLTVISIITTAALSNLLKSSRTNALKSDARDLENIFAISRMEAIKRNCSVTILFNKNDQDCLTFIDSNHSCEFDPPQETVLLKYNLSSAFFDSSKSDGDGLSFIENDNGYPSLRWDNRGLPHRNGNGFGAGTAYLCNEESHYCIIVSKTGLIRIKPY